MKYYLAGLLLLTVSGVKAGESYPPSCRPLAVQKETLILTAKKPLLVLINNRSKDTLWLTHPVSEASASAGWSSQVESGNWSALVLDKNSFEISCIESRPGHEQQIPCAGMIAACEWPEMASSAQSAGTFWAVENSQLSALISSLGEHGFTPSSK